MKISHWFIVAGFIAPLFACSASEDGNNAGAGGDAGTAGSSGSVIPSGGTGGTGTGGTGAGETGGTGGTGTGGTGAGTTGGTGGGGTGGTGGGTTVEECKASGYTDPACGACMEANCAPECEACMSDPACMGWLSCVVNNDCQDQACYDACTGQYPGGDVSALAWFGNSGCIGTKCGTECGMTSGDDCGPAGYQPGPCGECLGTKCVAQCEACLADPACNGWLSCVINNDCEDQACYDACDAQNPGGSEPALDWLGNSGCVGTQCGVECEVGGGASCDADGYTDPTCGACMATNCKTECEACLANAACVSWLNCVIDNDCETEACYNDCTAANPGGDTLALAWFGTEGCIGLKCDTECN